MSSKLWRIGICSTLPHTENACKANGKIYHGTVEVKLTLQFRFHYWFCLIIQIFIDSLFDSFMGKEKGTKQGDYHPLCLMSKLDLWHRYFCFFNMTLQNQQCIGSRIKKRFALQIWINIQNQFQWSRYVVLKHKPKKKVTVYKSCSTCISLKTLQRQTISGSKLYWFYCV